MSAPAAFWRHTVVEGSHPLSDNICLVTTPTYPAGVITQALRISKRPNLREKFVISRICLCCTVLQAGLQQRPRGARQLWPP